jgi:hypothetical protein
MRNDLTPADWRRSGALVGHERGTLDRLNGERQDLDALWIPAGTPSIYATALKRGYLAGLKGDPSPDSGL